MTHADYTNDIRRPAEYSAEDLDAFAALVRLGGKVAPGVRRRIETAELLGVVRTQDAIVGVAAVKKPTDHYRDECFRKAESTKGAEAYPLELGWIVMHPDHREGKKMGPLIADLIDRVSDEGLFATTASAAVVHMLHKGGFKADGSTYPSDLGDEALTLLLRNPDP